MNLYIPGKIVSGYGIASGRAGSTKYPDGTLALQKPFFLARGLDISMYHLGTLNVDISPYSYKVINPKHTFSAVAWTEKIKPENFFFFDIEVLVQKKVFTGLIYMPDPETKEEHFQNQSIIELLLPSIPNLDKKEPLLIKANPKQIRFYDAIKS